MDLGSIDRAARQILAINFASYHFAELTGGWQITLAPIWEPGPEGEVMRRAWLAPREMRAHYYVGRARTFLDGPELGRVALRLMEWTLSDGKRVAALRQELRALYVDEDAPCKPLDVEWSDVHGVLSYVLADIARKARVGMTPDEIVETRERHTIV